MSIDAYRWQMNKPGEPFEKVAFSAVAAAAEVVVGMAIFVVLYKNRRTIDVTRMDLMKN